MHHAPAVSFPLGRSRFLGYVLAGAWFAGVGVIALWWYQQPHWRWPQGVGVLAVLAGGVLSGRWWNTHPTGVLRWDGERWQAVLDGLAVTGSVSVHLDLQRQLLLKLCSSAPPSDRWLWLERDADPAVWRDVRRAVYSRAGSQTSANRHATSAPP